MNEQRTTPQTQNTPNNKPIMKLVHSALIATTRIPLASAATTTHKAKQQKQTITPKSKQTHTKKKEKKNKHTQQQHKNQTKCNDTNSKRKHTYKKTTTKQTNTRKQVE